ncbi:alpha/beta fold hydrolase [Microbulbifer harenosus]|uniref:Alpha/beta hydrolase n=1 Tax=Microbulbifer harenosus TaxID=2576840 RepID=A0ABY2UIK7_9GAMM|nr:alpha/beta hydrolase [Microbulbifer harenosus]TLM77809.1 alpha/beta hydrolase [Microbulbifer harenosus]
MSPVFRASIALFLLATAQPSLSLNTIPVDDSYTPSERYYRYKKQDSSLKWPALTFTAGQQVFFDRRYKQVDQRELHLDVFMPAPETSNQQTIVMIHGGGWRSGQRSHMYALANRLAQRGYTLVLPEFRLSLEAPYPAAMEDVNDVLQWLNQNASDYGIVTDRIAVLGGSSGGYMASLLAYAGPSQLFGKSDVRVNALIDLDGVLNLDHERPNPESPLQAWLGSDREQSPELWRQAAPTSHLSKTSPATLVISSGQPRFTLGHKQVGETLKGFDIPYQYYEFPEVIHTYWLFEPYVSQSVDIIEVFLRKLDKDA